MACAPIPRWRATPPPGARALALWWAWSMLPWTLGLAAARGLWRR